MSNYKTLNVFFFWKAVLNHVINESKHFHMPRTKISDVITSIYGHSRSLMQAPNYNNWRHYLLNNTHATIFNCIWYKYGECFTINVFKLSFLKHRSVELSNRRLPKESEHGSQSSSNRWELECAFWHKVGRNKRDNAFWKNRGNN